MIPPGARRDPLSDRLPMFSRQFPRQALAAILIFSAAPAPAQEGADVAQLYDRPPADLVEEAPPPAPPPHDAAMSLRLDRLEREIRQMTGRIEELQHQVRVLEDQLPARPAERSGAAPAAGTAAPVVPPAPPAASGNRRSDAFDAAADPGLPGAPRPLGTTTPSAPLGPGPRAVTTPPREPGAPLDLTQGRLAQEPASPSPGPAAPLGAPLAEAVATPPPAKSEYDQALSSLRAGQYEAAEKSFAAFLVRNPKSKLAPAATFNLGESFFLRGRHREAAERYLEISTKYAQSSQAPDAMLRLGQSLNALGAREQACASFSEIGVKYPNASPRVKETADREMKKLQC